MGLRKRLHELSIKINFFDEEEEELSLIDQLFATKVFILLIAITLSIVIIFTAFTLQTHTVTVQAPSKISFNQLYIKYPSTLSCPCTQSTIHQDQFLSFNPQYHPICTSQLINQTFISSSLSDMNMSDYWPLDYRIMIASHFQILSLLCQTIQQTVLDAVEEFSTRYIITNKVLFYDNFYAQSAALVKQLKTTTLTNHKHTSDFLWFSISQNRIFSGLRTNYFIQADPTAITNKFITVNYKSSNVTCSCAQNNTCVHQASIYNGTGRAGVNVSTTFGNPITDPPLLFDIPGLMVGCLPYNSLLQSTLECFYNQSCIDIMQTFINGLTLVLPLSSSRFQQNSTVDDLLNELFIESWNNQSNFTRYFHVCSPQSCTYSYDRRLNLLYIIITIISLFGGLRIVTYFLSLYIVMIIRRIQKMKCCRNTTDEITIITQENLNQSLKDRFVCLIRQIYQKLVTFNVFPLSSNLKDGLYSTRIYVILLIIGILILVFYTSISIQIRNVTVYHPSLDQYEILYEQYPSTLVCPCTQLSLSHRSIMFIQPHYHQVCSSDFIKNDKWLLYFRGLTGAFYSFDFRVVGVQLFLLLQTLCHMSNETVTNELSVFNDTQFVSVRVLAKDIFGEQTSALIQQFQRQTIDSFLALLKILRTSIQLNQFIMSVGSNAKLTTCLTYDDMSLRFTSEDDYDNSCSCGTNNSCTRSQGFYCRRTSCFLSPRKPNQTIPGLLISCLPMDSLLASTLQCFYSISCIQMLIEWRSFDSLNVTIDPRVLNITPLDSMINSRFAPDNTLDDIVSQLFIENWIDSVNFSSYYKQCAPNECTYTYEERFNKAYLVSMILGIVGGLSVALRITILPVVKLLRRIYYRSRRPQQCVVREAFVERNKNICITSFRNKILRMNLYHQKQKNQILQEPLTADQILLIHRQEIATRFYIILLFFAIIAILIFTGLNTQTHSVTVSSPNQFTFEQLQSQYSSTFSCPCSQIAIQYSKFLSVKPSAYHQVCSSYFISSDFIKFIWGTNSLSEYIFYIDGKVLSTQFRLLSSFCSLAENAIDQKIEIFSSQKLISIETLTPSSFQNQIDSIIDRFIIQTPANFRRIHKYIMDMLHANQLHNLFYTNWNITISDPINNYIMSTSPTSYNDSGSICSCATSSTCSRSYFTRDNKRGLLPGLVLGCLPIYGLRQSTLECFYNSTCLKIITSFVGYSHVLTPLNISLITRFTPIASVSIGTLIDELFIETWENTSNYSNYFSTCAPLTCRYTYVQRNDAIYMLTTFLGIYGGLTIGLKFFIWQVLCIYWIVRQWFTHRCRRIYPIE